MSTSGNVRNQILNHIQVNCDFKVNCRLNHNWLEYDSAFDFWRCCWWHPWNPPSTQNDKKVDHKFHNPLSVYNLLLSSIHVYYMICSTNQNGVVNGKKLFLLVFCWFFWAAWPDICTTHASMTKRWEEEERQAGKEFFFLMLGNHKNWGDIVKNGWSFPFLSKADFSLNSRSNFALFLSFIQQMLILFLV